MPGNGHLNVVTYVVNFAARGYDLMGEKGRKKSAVSHECGLRHIDLDILCRYQPHGLTFSFVPCPMHFF